MMRQTVRTRRVNSEQALQSGENHDVLEGAEGKIEWLDTIHRDRNPVKHLIWS